MAVSAKDVGMLWHHYLLKKDHVQLLIESALHSYNTESGQMSHFLYICNKMWISAHFQINSQQP